MNTLSTQSRNRSIWGTYVDDLIAQVSFSTVHSTLSIEYAHSDRQYNVRGLSDSTGNITELYAYTPYGERTILDANGTILTSASTDYGYTGRRFDSETGLWYFRSRYFDTAMGRFISRDPIGYKGGGMGLYNGYFAQIFLMDYSGHGPNGGKRCNTQTSCPENMTRMAKKLEAIAWRLGEINKWNNPNFYHNNQPAPSHASGWPSNANKLNGYDSHVGQLEQVIRGAAHCSVVLIKQYKEGKCGCSDEPKEYTEPVIPSYITYDPSVYESTPWWARGGRWIEDSLDTGGTIGTGVAIGAGVVVGAVIAAPYVAAALSTEVVIGTGATALAF